MFIHMERNINYKGKFLIWLKPNFDKDLYL